MMTYQDFIAVIQKYQEHQVRFYLPGGKAIASHVHITDVGSRFNHRIDCGGQARKEEAVEVQLWLGKDRWHRLYGKTLVNIFSQSQPVLSGLHDLQNASINVEYQIQEMVQYQLDDVKIGQKEISVYLASKATQCLAVNRYVQDKLAQVKQCCNGVVNCC